MVGKSGHCTDSLTLPHRAMRLYWLGAGWAASCSVAVVKSPPPPLLKAISATRKKKNKAGYQAGFPHRCLYNKEFCWVVHFIHCTCTYKQFLVVTAAVGVIGYFNQLEARSTITVIPQWASVVSGNLDLTWFRGTGTIRASAVGCCVFATLLLSLSLLFQTGLPG